MRDGGRAGRTVVLRLRFDDYSRATRSTTLTRATAATTAGAGPGQEAADETPSRSIARAGITLIGIAITNLDPRGSGVQLELLARERPRRGARRSPRRPSRAIRLPARSPAVRRGPPARARWRRRGGRFGTGEREGGRSRQGRRRDRRRRPQRGGRRALESAGATVERLPRAGRGRGPRGARGRRRRLGRGGRARRRLRPADGADRPLGRRRRCRCC